VRPCGGVHDAPKLLSAMAGPGSPILELFYVVSHNTAVNDQKIKSTFQPAQVLADPNATDRLIGPGNQPYVSALGQLGLALDAAGSNPNITTDAAAFAPVAQQVTAAKGAVGTSSQAFNVDREMGTEKTVVALMQAPIDCVDRLAPSPNAGGNAGGASICGVVNPLAGKFPFSSNPNAQASLAEVDRALAPETGVLWDQYNKALKPFLVQQGTQYVAAPGAPAPVNPRFQLFFNHAAHASSELYPAGAKAASFTFSLRFIPGGGVSSATFVVDGQQMAAGTNTQQFTWNGASAQSASLTFDGNSALQNQGTWALFQLVRTAVITPTAGGYRLDYKISNTTTIQGHTVNQGGPTKTVTFELSGTGADLLAGGALGGLSCPAPALLKK